MMAFNGHGAVRLITVSTSIAARITKRVRRCGRSRSRISGRIAGDLREHMWDVMVPEGSPGRPTTVIERRPPPDYRHPLSAWTADGSWVHLLDMDRTSALRFGSTFRFGSVAADSQTPVARLRRRARRRRAVRRGWHRHRRPG